MQQNHLKYTHLSGKKPDVISPGHSGHKSIQIKKQRQNVCKEQTAAFDLDAAADEHHSRLWLSQVNHRACFSMMWGVKASETNYAIAASSHPLSADGFMLPAN